MPEWFEASLQSLTANAWAQAGLIMLAAVIGATISHLLFKRVFVKLTQRTQTDLDDQIIARSLGFVSIWVILLVIGTLALAAAGSDVMTSFSAAAASLGNVGPAFGAAGPSHTYDHFHTFSKLVMALLMILGRLEIYTVLIVLTPRFWRF